MVDNLDELHAQIVKDSIKLIKEKNVDISQLSFKLGISVKELYNTLTKRSEDFSIYFKIYDTLTEWEW